MTTATAARLSPPHPPLSPPAPPLLPTATTGTAVATAMPPPLPTILSASPAPCVVRDVSSREGPPTDVPSGRAGVSGGKRFKVEN